MAHFIWAWDTYETNAIEMERAGHLISMAYKWLGEKKTYVIAQCDYEGYEPKSDDDSKLCEDIWKLLDSADVIIGHNAQNFDIKKINYRLMINGFTPTSPYKVVDTLTSLRRVAKAPSAKLDALGKDFHLGRKLEHEGWELWKKCYLGDKDAWYRMKKYNKQDVVLLEKWYLKLRPWIVTHPNMNIILGGVYHCPHCGSEHTRKKGFNHTRTCSYQAYLCNNCGHYSQGEVIQKNHPLR
jgi:uncharacterized protein YprB with RNaseH-like and TPR domain